MFVDITSQNITFKDLPPTFVDDMDKYGVCEMEQFDEEEDGFSFTENTFTFSDGRVFKGYYGYVRTQEGFVYYNNIPVYRYRQNGIELIDNKLEDKMIMEILNNSFELFCEEDIARYYPFQNSSSKKEKVCQDDLSSQEHISKKIKY